MSLRDMQVAVNHLSSDVSKPTQRSWRMLKRIGRRFKKHQRVQQHEFEEQNGERGPELIVYSDSDWAGRRTTRKRRTESMILMSGGLIRSWSNRQGLVTLPSGEAEYYAVVKASAEALGAQALARDLGWVLKITAHMNSSAKTIASRIGLGRVRHLEVRFFWLQEAAAKKKLT